ncbi:MAG TPA: pinensin family lanthipeptide [Longimicrobium sp.]
MSNDKLKLDEVKVESFETGDADGGAGTVKANELLRTVDGTCRGQTGLCTACPPIDCY